MQHVLEPNRLPKVIGRRAGAHRSNQIGGVQTASSTVWREMTQPARTQRNHALVEKILHRSSTLVTSGP